MLLYVTNAVVGSSSVANSSWRQRAQTSSTTLKCETHVSLETTTLNLNNQVDWNWKSWGPSDRLCSGGHVVPRGQRSSSHNSSGYQRPSLSWFYWFSHGMSDRAGTCQSSLHCKSHRSWIGKWQITHDMKNIEKPSSLIIEALACDALHVIVRRKGTQVSIDSGMPVAGHTCTSPWILPLVQTVCQLEGPTNQISLPSTGQRKLPPSCVSHSRFHWSSWQVTRQSTASMYLGWPSWHDRCEWGLFVQPPLSPTLPAIKQNLNAEMKRAQGTWQMWL